MSEVTYQETFNACVAKLVNDVEKRLDRKLTLTELQGIKASGTLMFLESIANHFYSCKTDYELDFWLSEIDGFERK